MVGGALIGGKGVDERIEEVSLLEANTLSILLCKELTCFCAIFESKTKHSSQRQVGEKTIE